MREMNSNIDMSLEMRQNGCLLCKVKETDDLDQKFNLPLNSFDEINDLESRLQDTSTKQQLVLFNLTLVAEHFD